MDFSYVTATSEADWQEWTTRNVDASDSGLSLSRTTAVRSRSVGDSIRDMAVDSSGLLYTLSTSGALAQYDPNTESRRSILHTKTSALVSPMALAASSTQLFVAGENAVRQVSLQRGRETGRLQSTATQPSDLTYDRGTVYARDAGGVRSVGDKGAPFEWAIGTVRDMAVTDGELYALVQSDGDFVVRCEGSTEPLLTAEDFTFEGEPFEPTALSAPGGTIFLAGSFPGREKSGVFEWDPEDDRFEQFVELPGRCHRLVGHSGRDGFRTVYAVVGENRECLALTEIAENVRHPEQDKHVGMAVSQFDSGVDGMEWHRLALDLARSSASTQVRVWYKADDQETLLPSYDVHRTTASIGVTTTAEGEQALFSPDVQARLRAIGIETVQDLTAVDAGELATRSADLSIGELKSYQTQAIDALEAEIESGWTHVSDTDSTDILLREATGRYLKVAVELRGTPTASPLIGSVTAYCPRQSYLRYMPELYQQDGESSAFLEQFLSVFETSFSEIESEIDDITQYFDPAGAPSDSLEWLEEWLAADEYREWPESARREYLARAPELYKMRGTRAGVREIIELYLRHAGDETADVDSEDTVTGHRLFFLDRSDIDQIQGSTGVDVFESLLPNDRSLAIFCGPFESERHQREVETIVATETPAHIDATVHTLDEEFILGKDTLLGLNSELGTQSFSLGDAALGKDSYLGASD